MSTTRGTSNTNDRGNTADRRRRKAWLLATYDEDLGPDTCRCAECRVELDWDSVQLDRIVPGALGGRYTRDNIRPLCALCNIRAGVILREQLHRSRCHGTCRRCQMTREYYLAREAAELAREQATGGYATEMADYGRLISFGDMMRGWSHK